MKVSIKYNTFRLFLIVPLSLGSIAIKCIPEEHLNSHDKKIALQLFKSLKSCLKDYKGLQVVEVVMQNGNRITITI